MHSRARIVAEASGRASRLTHLQGDAALTVRPTPTAGHTRVHLVAGAFGPLGGDELTLEIEVALPPTVVAAGARHTLDVDVRVAGDASLLPREETIRGRTGESGGVARLLTRVEVAGQPVLRQDFELCGEVGGPWRPRAVGSLLVVGPAFVTVEGAREERVADLPQPARAAWLTLPRGAGHLFTAMEDDPLALSQLLDRQLPR